MVESVFLQTCQKLKDFPEKSRRKKIGIIPM